MISFKKSCIKKESNLDILHYWPMNEGSGTIVYDIVGNVDAVLSGSAAWEIGGGVLCNEFDAYVRLGSSSDLSLNVTDARSIYFLYTYKPGTVTTSTRYFFSASNAGYTVFSFFDSFTSKKTIAYMDSGAWTTSINNGVAPWVVENTQFHVCYQWNSSTEEIEVWYGIGGLDNLLTWNSVGNVSVLSSQYYLDIGGRHDVGNNRYSEGIISDVMIINGWIK